MGCPNLGAVENWAFIPVLDELEWLRGSFEHTYLISSAVCHDKDKCLNPETGLIQDPR